MTDLPIIFQPDGITCGPSCLKSVLIAKKLITEDSITVESLGNLIGTNPKTGTIDTAMAKGLDLYNVMYSRYLEIAKDPMKELRFSLAWNYVILRTLSAGKHWVVAYDQTDTGIKIMCPIRGYAFWTDEECDRFWKARDYHSFVIPKGTL
jgi:hypothetical protein